MEQTYSGPMKIPIYIVFSETPLLDIEWNYLDTHVKLFQPCMIIQIIFSRSISVVITSRILCLIHLYTILYDNIANNN